LENAARDGKSQREKQVWWLFNTLSAPLGPPRQNKPKAAPLLGFGFIAFQYTAKYTVNC